MNVLNTVFLSNRAGSGGGAFYGPNFSATNTLFADNFANQGGAIYLRRRVPNEDAYPPSSFTNATFARNGASDGAAIFSRALDSEPIVNSVLWDIGSGASELASDGSGASFDVGNSCVFSGVPSGYDRGHNLATCGDSGGGGPFVGTTDFHLVPGAAAVNAGNDAAPGLTGVSTDLDGRPRFVGTVDMGAYEQ
jgi:predicted outer membrane repeat protein